MLRIGRYTYKLAETRAEFEQIHRLNYKTFVHEIGQYEDNGSGVLVDKFHEKNVYFLVLRDYELVGMLSAHDQPPFSVVDRIASKDLLFKDGNRPLEVRQLSVLPDERNGIHITGLTYELFLYGRRHGHTHFVISGVTSQLRLYKHIGFEVLGPAVGKEGAQFVPMSATLDRVECEMQRTMKLWRKRIEREAAKTDAPIAMIPGPVPLADDVRAAFAEPPIYHRGPEFVALFEEVRNTLCKLVNAPAVAMTVGSGTLANEFIAATLAADPQADAGLMLVNGEFGKRIVKQIQRFGVNPRVIDWPAGKPWNLTQVDRILAEMPSGGWVWGVHQESSTGVINDLPGLVKIAKKRGIRVCSDCVSSVGAVPVNLQDVYLASAATGKALSSYAGLALVFADPVKLEHLDTSRIPSYYDLLTTLGIVGPRYTMPSSLLRAVAVALQVYVTPGKAKARFDHYAALGRYVRQRLSEIGLPPLAPEECASPVITSFYPPGRETSNEFVSRCLTWGFLIGGQSGYLAEERIVQIANMGSIKHEELEQLFENLERWLRHRRESNGR
jgi:aspartate aminotransferase-like enzyme